MEKPKERIISMVLSSAVIASAVAVYVYALAEQKPTHMRESTVSRLTMPVDNAISDPEF